MEEAEKKEGAGVGVEEEEEKREMTGVSYGMKGWELVWVWDRMKV